MQLSHKGAWTLRSLEPYCHKCAWEGRGAIGVAENQRLVGGRVQTPFQRQKYVATLDLCEVCLMLFDGSMAFQLECSKMAARHLKGITA